MNKAFDIPAQTKITFLEIVVDLCLQSSSCQSNKYDGKEYSIRKQDHNNDHLDLLTQCIKCYSSVPLDCSTSETSIALCTMTPYLKKKWHADQRIKLLQMRISWLCSILSIELGEEDLALHWLAVTRSLFGSLFDPNHSKNTQDETTNMKDDVRCNVVSIDASNNQKYEVFSTQFSTKGCDNAETLAKQISVANISSNPIISIAHIEHLTGSLQIQRTLFSINNKLESLEFITDTKDSESFDARELDGLIEEIANVLHHHKKMVMQWLSAQDDVVNTDHTNESSRPLLNVVRLCMITQKWDGLAGLIYASLAEYAVQYKEYAEKTSNLQGNALNSENPLSQNIESVGLTLEDHVVSERITKRPLCITIANALFNKMPFWTIRESDWSKSLFPSMHDIQCIQSIEDHDSASECKNKEALRMATLHLLRGNFLDALRKPYSQMNQEIDIPNEDGEMNYESKFDGQGPMREVVTMLVGGAIFLCHIGFLFDAIELCRWALAKWFQSESIESNEKDEDKDDNGEMCNIGDQINSQQTKRILVGDLIV